MSDTLIDAGAVDGNAVLGALSIYFGRPMDEATLTCRDCASVHPVAVTAVYHRAPGIVVRCPDCQGAELVIVSVRRQVRVTMPGISALTF